MDSRMVLNVEIIFQDLEKVLEFDQNIHKLLKKYKNA